MSANRDKGTRWESAVVTYLQTNGWPNAERRAMHGANDRGDVAGIVGLIIEAKSATRVELAAWLDEATREANHAQDKGVVWFKRRGHTSPGSGFVLMDGQTLVNLLTEAGYQ